MRTAEEVFADCINAGKGNKGIMNGVILCMKEYAKEVLVEAANKVKTYKVGNAGSWLDAAPDRSTILNLIKELK